MSEAKRRAETRPRTFVELKAKIQIGLDQLDRGETAQFDLEEFLAARNAEHRKSAMREDRPKA